MGRKWKKFKKAEKELKNMKAKKPEQVVPERIDYAELVRENKDFEAYYKAQKIVPEGEWDQFIQCLKEDLPAAFRLTGNKREARSLLRVLKQKFFDPVADLHKNNSEEAVKPLKPVCLPWYPDNLAWQLNLTRKNIRESEAYWRLHQFLITETETGNISRQESVSMIPPLVLGVEPHHKVLDLCAAPGSKTAQLIELLHSSEDSLCSSVPPGVIVANDVNNKRCYMLAHQAKRLQSPCIVITNHDAAFMPNIYHTGKEGRVGPIKFDRILCDVPCSGDGTMRKNYDIWTKFNAVKGVNLHGLQLRIARRGLEMLALGGLMVYSTCSFNPLENEAVVHRLLVEAEGSVQLVDISHILPGLKFIPGVEEWTIMNRELDIIETPDDIPLKNTNLFNRHVFPPSAEDRGKYDLKKCIRILPHHQNTGGFFVAVLEKVRPLSSEKVILELSTSLENVSSQDSENEGQAAGQETNLMEVASPDRNRQRIKQPPKKRRRQGFREEPYYYLEQDDSMWPNISSFYDMKDVVDPTLFLSRTQAEKRRILYFTNALVKDIVNLNQDRIKIINTGVKALVRCDNKGTTCDFRLSQDGAQVMLPLLTNRKLHITREDLVDLLLNDDMEKPPLISLLHASTQEQCKNMSTGAVAFVYKEAGGADDATHIELVGWKGKQSVRTYVNRNERIHYLRLLDADTSKYEKNKFVEQKDDRSTNGPEVNIPEMSIDEDNHKAETLNLEKESSGKNEESLSTGVSK